MPRLNRPTLALAVITLAILTAGYLIPDKPIIPVQQATAKDWNPKSFWFEPWGASGVHKGIDIFAPQGQPVLSAVPGVVVYRGQLAMGGNAVVVLGPKWRFHYYAHLARIEPTPRFVAQGTRLGAVGTTGNAAGKPPHLHYTVASMLPLPWRFSAATQGWKQVFFLDPSALLKRGAASS